MSGLSLVLPTLDEVDALGVLLPALLVEVPRLSEVLVVDDGSTDGTRALVHRAAQADRRVVLIEREGDPSVAGALRAGLAAARGDLVGWMDADGTIGAADLNRLLDAVDRGADVAVGSRYAPGGRVKGQRSDGVLGRVSALFRVSRTADEPLAVLGSWVLNTAVLPLLLGGRGHDYTSGFVVGRRAALGELDLAGAHGAYFIELWGRLHRAGIDVVDVPYAAKPRLTGRSKAGGSLFDYLGHARHYLSAALSARRG